MFQSKDKILTAEAKAARKRALPTPKPHGAPRAKVGGGEWGLCPQGTELRFRSGGEGNAPERLGEGGFC